MKTNENIFKDMEEMEQAIETPHMVIRSSPSKAWWKYICTFLFSACMVLECINVVLTSNCKNSHEKIKPNISILKEIWDEMSPL